MESRYSVTGSDKAMGWTIHISKACRGKPSVPSPRRQLPLWYLSTLIFNEHQGSFSQMRRLEHEFEDLPYGM